MFKLSCPRFGDFLSPRQALCLIICAGPALLMLSACGQDRQQWPPFSQQTSNSILEAEALQAQQHVRDAASSLHSSPDDAADSLAEADRMLGHLTHYYLPLLEARARAHNAYAYYANGDSTQALAELEAVEDKLMQVSSEGGHAERAVREPEATLAAIRLEVEAKRLRDPALFAELLRSLNETVTKGPIELGPE